MTYAFDVLMQIYSEAGWSEREAAASIVRNNLFGLDIDDRAGQLAYFAVMMRARKYNRGIFREKVSPNIFALKDSSFLTDDLIEAVTGDDIVKKSLFELRDVFSNAKEFGSLVHVPDIDLTLVLSVATAFCERFADDLMTSAYQETVTDNLIPLIKQAIILSGKYEVVATNPPFLNKFDATLKKFLTKEYKDYSSDLFSVFMYRNFDFCKENGYSGFMTPNVWMFIKSYEKLRNYILKEKNIVSLIQMAKGAFFKEATVDICAFILKNAKENIKGLYFRLEDFKGGMEVQREKVLEALANKNCGYFYETTESNFSKIPSSPIAYWLSHKVFECYIHSETMEKVAHPKVGMQTSNNDKYLRLWQEVNFSEFIGNSYGLKWIKYLKGGMYRKWYGNLEFILFYNYSPEYILSQPHSRVLGLNFLSMKKCTWTDLTSGDISFRFAPDDTFYDISGHCFFPDEKDQYWLLAYSNTKFFSEMKKVFNSTFHCQCGDVAKIVVPHLGEKQKNNVSDISKMNVHMSKLDWDSYETSWDFKRNPMI